MEKIKQRLGDVVSCNTSAWNKKLGWKKMNYLDTSNITNGVMGKIATFHIGQDKVPSRARRLANDGDIVYSTVRPNKRHYGMLKNVPENFVVSTGFSVLRSKDPGKFDTAYIYYCLTQDDIVNYLHGIAESNTSAYPALNPEDILSLELDFPTISQQQSVSTILGLLDEKIRINNQMNGVLEGIAKSIFKSWFVDFDPVRAKVARQSTGLSKDIESLFPVAFAESPIGKIPKDWSILRGSQIYAQQKGLSYKGKFLSKENMDFPLLNLGSFAGGGEYRKEKLKFSNEPHKERHKIFPGDLLIANTDITQDRIIIGSPILVPNAPNKHPYFLFTHHTTKITPLEDSPLSRVYLYFNFLQKKFRDRVNSYATGTTVLSLPKDTLSDLEILIPPSRLLEAFDGICNPIQEKRTLLLMENQILAELRDLLLPNLISGKISVSEAEKIVGEQT